MSQVNDAEFLAAFARGERPGGVFRHADHVRLAWLLVRREGAARGEELVAAGIRAFAAGQGVPELYHDTLTRAWVRLVAAALAATPAAAADFERFLAAHPQLADKTLVFRFYSPAALSRPAARSGWIEPDLRPLPARVAALASPTG